jgi:hypothetical protein
MAETIPDRVLDAALKEIANFSDAEARAEIDRISMVQPALVVISFSFPKSLGQDHGV